MLEHEKYRKYGFVASIKDDGGNELIDGFQIQKFEKLAWSSVVVSFVPLSKDGDIFFKLESQINKLFDIRYSLLDSSSKERTSISFKMALCDYELESDYGSEDFLIIKLYFDRYE